MAISTDEKTNVIQSSKGISRYDRIIDSVLLIVLLGVISHTVFINFKYISKPIVEWYSFRQTQTALTADYLIKNGFSFKYETPVAGEPWSIPYEFPIFQQVVAWVSTVFHLPLTDTGRSVCFVFFALSSYLLFRIMKRLGLGLRETVLAQIYFWVLPVNIFWAGTFMIEYAALFFTLCFLYFAIKIIQRSPSYVDILGAGIFLTLALLQKITTALAVLMMVGIALVFYSGKLKDLRQNKINILGIALLFMIPMLLGYKWVKFTDEIKSQNAIGFYLTSEQLKTWNYGTLDQRMSSELWTKAIYERSLKPLGGPLIIIACIASVFFIDKKRKILAAVSLLLFILPYLVFTNLYIRHDYYQAANNVFLCAFLGICLTGIIGPLGRINAMRSTLFLMIMLASTGLSISNFYKSIFYKQKSLDITFTNEKILMLAEYVRTHTPENSVVVWYGCDWNSSGAFYSKRKSLTVPDYGDLEIATINNMERFLSSRPSAIVVCPFGRRETVERTLKEKYPEMRPHNILDSTVYTSAN